MKRFYSEVFFPYLEEHNIDKVLQVGDLFDNKKQINLKSLTLAKEYFFDVMDERDITLFTFVGNHDSFHKNSIKINTQESLLYGYNKIRTFSKPTSWAFEDLPVLILPWICDENYDQCMKMIDAADPKCVVFGHLELAGFEMHRGSIVNKGMDSNIFSKFHAVYSGHYHHRSSKGNITYLGTPYEMTWADYEDQKGFHVFDTDTLEMTFIPNPYHMFHIITYDDSKNMDIDFEELSGTVIKLVVERKDNETNFEQFVHKIEEQNPFKFNIIEQKTVLNMEEEDDVTDAESTLAILRKVINNSDVTVDKSELNEYLTGLYTEALYMG
jgi:DNA repair exonuclease SbcCD nuclease subunit